MKLLHHFVFLVIMWYCCFRLGRAFNIWFFA